MVKLARFFTPGHSCDLLCLQMRNVVMYQKEIRACKDFFQGNLYYFFSNESLLTTVKLSKQHGLRQYMSIYSGLLELIKSYKRTIPGISQHYRATEVVFRIENERLYLKVGQNSSRQEAGDLHWIRPVLAAAQGLCFYQSCKRQHRQHAVTH